MITYKCIKYIRFLYAIHTNTIHTKQQIILKLINPTYSQFKYLYILDRKHCIQKENIFLTTRHTYTHTRTSRTTTTNKQKKETKKRKKTKNKKNIYLIHIIIKTI